MRRSLQKRVSWLGIAAIGLLGGCQDFHFRPKEHSSAALLDSGPQPKLSKLQAADVYISLGGSHEQQGRFDQARAAYLEALKKDPKRADAELRLAILDDRKGDTAGADRHFARALKLKPQDPDILADQGYSFYLRRRWADAEISLKQALAVEPSHVRSHANLALVYARQGEDVSSLAEFAKAGLDWSDARANLALVFALEGRFDDAKREYGLALAAKPSSAHAREGLQATTIALAGKVDTRALAATSKVAQPADPGLVRTSATSPKAN